ncbi:hypothetical protein MKZ08_15150 [Viridibacillus sp. FSL R5-0477]|uniref:Holin n=1 Tax=Viridibacillus arenosi FSL R5-213 TaxID=1227360 RepID=W4ELY0_9BACL|nr:MULTISPECIES: hypothetical protein [Viridibacillus]ETT81012.1 hypothetical protein C176_19894 [Viridibacillus arenosi FSL R5-213]OMC83967.1 hypothetical protein BK130_05530 [Viridibacillus sp. FSL H8-0123]OMC88489.1 hypothetical protein BK128_00650 [Viridibacillus sp. FSL H7-0596]OMC93125.1 hypothetical protein BK137_00960 [Viridibacillus arenosi]
MNFPIIHTNFWDAVIAIPIIMIITQLFKIIYHTPSKFVPTISLFFGLFISIFISHRHDFFAGIFMGWFYGYAAVGNYAALKCTLISYRNPEK